jgi:hypothetical protein
MRTNGRPPELFTNVCTSVAFGACTSTEIVFGSEPSAEPPKAETSPEEALLESRPTSADLRGEPTLPRPQQSPTRAAAVSASARARPQGHPVRRREETREAVFPASL